MIDQSFLFGVLCSFLAACLNGSFGVPSKISSVSKTKTNAFIFTFYVMLGISFSSLPFKFTETKAFSSWGLLSGLLNIVAQGCAFCALSFIDLAIASGLWCGVAIFSSFLYGFVIVGDHISNILLAIIAMVLLVVGIFLLTYLSEMENNQHEIQHAHTHNDHQEQQHLLTQNHKQVEYDQYDQHQHQHNHQQQHQAWHTFQDHRNQQQQQLQQQQQQQIHPDLHVQQIGRKSSAPYTLQKRSSDGRTKSQRLSMDISNNIRTLLDEQGHEVRVQIDNFSIDKIQLSSRTKTILGYVFAICTGLFGGLVAAPMTAAEQRQQGLAFVYSMGIGMLVFCPLLLVLGGITQGTFSIFENVQQNWHVPVYGFLAGLIWNGGNIFSIIGTQYIGLSIAYPIMQTGLVVSGFWGIFMFKEMEGRLKYYYMLAGLIVIAGAVTLTYAK